MRKATETLNDFEMQARHAPVARAALHRGQCLEQRDRALLIGEPLAVLERQIKKHPQAAGTARSKPRASARLAAARAGGSLAKARGVLRKILRGTRSSSITNAKALSASASQSRSAPATAIA